MKEMAVSMNDMDMISILNKEIPNAKGNLTKYLWNQKNKNFISFYCENGIYSKNTLQGDTLYGLLWKFILNIDIEMDDTLKNMFISHLKTENEWNLSKYGIIFNVNMTNHSYHCQYGSSNSGKFTDEDKWEMFTLDSGSLYTFLLNDTTTSLSYYKIILEKYSKLYNDQWDYRILSHYYGNNNNNNNNNNTNKPLIGIDLPGGDSFNSPISLPLNSNYSVCWKMCNNTIGCMAWTFQPSSTSKGCNQYNNSLPNCFLKSSVPKENINECLISGIEENNKTILAASRPACTSHYDRQLIAYSFIFALNGQKYDARNGKKILSLSPKQQIFNNNGDCIPVLIPGASSLFCKQSQNCYKIHVMFGKLILNELLIYNKKIQWNENKKILNMIENEYEFVCH